MLEIIKELEKHKVGISLNNQELELSFDGDYLSDDVIDLVRSNKQELILFLQKYSAEDQLESIQVQTRQSSYALSPGQFRIWLVSQAPEASVAYNVPNTHFLRGHYDIATLEKAVSLTIERHESLRTVFRKDDSGNVHQWILAADDIDFSLEQYDFRNEPEAQLQARAIIKQDSTKIFDLEHGPLLRVKLFQLPSETYVFYYNMHHIISDTWSLEILVRDVMAYYQSLLLERSPVLPELPIQYKDYAAWINQQFQDDISQNGRAYWKEKLKGNELPVLTLPGAKLRPKIKSYNGASLETYIGRSDVNTLRRFCSEQDISLYMGLLSIWKFLLYRYTGNEDIIVGTGVAGRDHLDLENQIGCFINLIPFRNTLSEKDTFLSLCEKVKNSTLEAYEYQSVPFDIILKDIEIKRDSSRNPLFDTMLFLQNAKENKGSEELSKEHIERIILKGKKGALTDIDINFIEQGDYLLFSTVYNTDVYEESSVRALVQHFKLLVKRLPQHPNLLLNEVDFISDEETKQLIEFNNTAKSYSTTATISSEFEKQVKLNPTAIALRCGSVELTYAKLNIEVDLLADYFIQKHAIKSEDLVALKLERSEWLVIAVLAVIKSGGAYIPIDPNYPETRTNYILQDSQARFVVDDNFIKEYLKIGYKFSEKVTPVCKANNLAYVIYTSGSTGNPKGVMIEHRNLISFFTNLEEKFCFSSVSNVAATTNYTFDISVLEILGSLCTGRKLILFTSQELLDSRRFIEVLSTEKVELLQLTPSRLKLLTEVTQTLPECIKVLLVGGEALPVNLKNDFIINNPDIRLINVYGPTETTIWSSSGEQKLEPKVDIGQPLYNEKIYLYSKFPHLAPVGVVGELCISGDGVGRGYLNRPELTAQKFITHDIDGVPCPLYFTGDLARWLPNGAIEFLGRKDNQVKIRGHRIELSEIESKILEYPNVKQVVVTDKKLADSVVLVAYLIPASELDKRYLREYLLTILPDYMVPGFFVELTAIPLNANGKIDFSQLPEVSKEDGIKHDYLVPGTNKEKALIRICEQLLGLKQIGLKDNYFDLGGDSTKIIRLISLLNKEAYGLDVEHIFKSRNFEELARSIYYKRNIADQAEVSGVVQLSPIHTYFFNSSNINVHEHFNLTFLLESNTAVEPDIIQKCFLKIIEHHDALRLTFSRLEDGSWQCLNNKFSTDSLHFYHYNFSDSSSAKQYMRQESARIQASFTLEKGPLVKVAHFRLPQHDYIALFIHHLVVDMHSLRIILEDLTALYESYQNGREISLPLKTDSYQNWTNYLAGFNENVLTKAERDYWLHLSKQEIPLLPTEFETGNNLNLTLNKHASFKLSENSSGQFKRLNLSNINGDIDKLVLTALGLAIDKIWGVNKTVIRFETPGRETIKNKIDVGRTVGWFTAIHPHILHTNGNNLEQNYRNISKSIQEIPESKLGYGTLSSYSKSFRNVVKPSIDYTFMGSLLTTVEEDNKGFTRIYEDLGYDSDPANGRDVLLDIKCSTSEQNLTISTSYSSDTYSDFFIDEFLKAYKKSLEDIISYLYELGADKKTQESSNTILNNWKSSLPISATNRQKEVLKAGSFMGIIGPVQLNTKPTERELECRFREFIQLHPVLCTKFDFVDETEVYQKYVDPDQVEIEIKSNHLDLNNYVELKNTIYPYLSKNFNLNNSNEPLIRLYLVSGLRESDADILFLSIHHALTDEKSNRVIQNNLQKFLNGQEVVLNDNYNLHFAEFEKNFINSNEGNKQRKFWLNYLGNRPNSAQSYSSTTFGNMMECIMQKCIISEDNFRAIENKSKDLQLPISAYLLAKYQIALNSILSDAPQFLLVFSNGRDIVLDEFGDENVLGAFNDFLILHRREELASAGFETDARQIYVEYMQARMNQKISYRTVKEDYLNSNKINLDEAIVGTFDLHTHLEEDCPELFQGKIETSININDFTRGIDLVCKVYKNAIELRVVYPKFFDEKITNKADVLRDFVRVICD